MISVVIPTFRRPAFLADCLASVRAQTHRDLEVLVCDNAADPLTAALVRDMGDPRFIHVPRPRDLGIQGNTLTGFAQARGQHVFKLDDDDLLRPDTLALLHQAMLDHPEAVCAFGTLVDAWVPERTLGPTREATRRRPPTVTEIAAHAPARPLEPGTVHGFAHMVARGDIHMGACLMRADAVRATEIAPASATAFDMAVLFQLSSGTAVHVPEAVIHYRRHPGADSITAPVPQSLGALSVLDSVVRRGIRPLDADMRAAYARTGARAARELLREGRAAEARSVLKSLPPHLHDARLGVVRALARTPRLARLLSPRRFPPRGGTAER